MAQEYKKTYQVWTHPPAIVLLADYPQFGGQPPDEVVGGLVRICDNFDTYPPCENAENRNFYVFNTHDGEVLAEAEKFLAEHSFVRE